MCVQGAAPQCDNTPQISPHCHPGTPVYPGLLPPSSILHTDPSGLLSPTITFLFFIRPAPRREEAKKEERRSCVWKLSALCVLRAGVWDLYNPEEEERRSVDV